VRGVRPAPSDALVGTLCYLLACMLWGLNIPVIAALLRHFDPFWMPALRYAIAASVLGAWVVATLGPARLRTPIPLWRVAGMSAVVAAFLLLLNVGLLHTDPITAAAVVAGSPVYVAVVSRMMTGARLADGFWGATLMTLVGAAIAVHGRADAAGHGLRLQGGELLLVASVACWTAYSILAQRWFSADTPQLRRTFLSSLGAIPWLLAFWAIARMAGWAGPPNLQPTAGALGILVFSAVFCTALATVAWNTGVARLGIAAGGLWQNTVPVFAVLSTLVLFGDVPTPGQVAGGGVVLVGVLYMQWHTRRAARRAAPVAVR
jgi:drug/metabolite transporter (DMT)-like permease